MKRIYISDTVHEYLKREAKREGRTLQWVVENRLTGTTPLGGTPIQNTPSPENTKPFKLEESFTGEEKTPKFGEHFEQPPSVVTITELGEMPCCANPYQPCKHWVWDATSGEGYKNTLSGRYREAE